MLNGSIFRGSRNTPPSVIAPFVLGFARQWTPLPASQVRKKLFVRRRDFDQWLERRRVHPRGAVDVSAMVNEIVAGVSGRK